HKFPAAAYVPWIASIIRMTGIRIMPQMVSAASGKSINEKGQRKKGGRSNRSPLKGTGVEREEIVSRPLRLFRGLRSAADEQLGVAARNRIRRPRASRPRVTRFPVLRRPVRPGL